MSDTNAVRLDAQVRIVGTGLLGASIGLALRSQGIDVALADSSPSSVHLAADLGAGRRISGWPYGRDHAGSAP